MSLSTMEEHDRMEALDSVGDSQLSYSADTKSETNTSSSSSSTKTVSLLDRLRAPTPSTLVRKRKISVNSAPPLRRNGRRDRKKRLITRIIGDHFGN